MLSDPNTYYLAAQVGAIVAVTGLLLTLLLLALFGPGRAVKATALCSIFIALFGLPVGMTGKAISDHQKRLGEDTNCTTTRIEVSSAGATTTTVC